MTGFNMVAQCPESTVVAEYTPSSVRSDAYQSEAALASARRLGVEFDATMPDGDPAVLRITCAGAFELGEVVTAVRLKLAELRLHARIRLLDGGTGAELRIFRGKR